MIKVKDKKLGMWFDAIPAENGMPMDVSFEYAVRTLVRMAVAQDPDMPVTIGLIVAVLAPKFSDLAEDDIARFVISAVIEEGGVVDQALLTPNPMATRHRADGSGDQPSFHRVH